MLLRQFLDALDGLSVCFVLGSGGRCASFLLTFRTDRLTIGRGRAGEMAPAEGCPLYAVRKTS
jgi:hypothetical protein